MQSRTLSAIEATLNIASGFLISFLVWVLVVPLFWPHLESPMTTSLGITMLFTITSWLRSYGWRRLFATHIHNWLEERRTAHGSCVVCSKPFSASETKIGIGFGYPNQFAHYDCYHRGINK